MAYLPYPPPDKNEASAIHEETFPPKYSFLSNELKQKPKKQNQKKKSTHVLIKKSGLRKIAQR